MAKSFITFYLFRYPKNAFHGELFLFVYSILEMELYFTCLVKNYSQVSALGCLESVANKKRHLPRKKKQFVKKFSTCRINFQFAKFTFQNYKFLISTYKTSMQLVKLFF